MPQFTYRARNAQGGLVEGVLDCADRAIAIRQIESQHCIPIRIDMVEAAKPAEAKASTPPHFNENCDCSARLKSLRLRKA